MPEPNEQQNSPLPLNPDLAGYPDVPSLVNGYRNSGAEAKRLREEVTKRDDLLMQVMQNSAANQRTVPDRRSSSPEDRLTEFGVPVDALNELVNNGIQRALQPIMRGVSARGKVVSDHPDYVQFEAEVARFIENDAELSQRYPKMFDADPEGAMEYAFLKFGESRRRTSAPPNGDDRQGMHDAAIPSSRAGEGRRAPTEDQAVRDAFERFQKTGSTRDAAAYAKTRLRSVIKDDFLNQ
tara:strand:- start:839 stop:1552 length:714 start_codon:yes stop_codon:yes gene_type:complete